MRAQPASSSATPPRRPEAISRPAARDAAPRAAGARTETPSSLHGDPRATNDADLIAVLFPIHFKGLKAELGDRFYLDEEDFLHAVKEERSFNLVDEIDLLERVLADAA